MKSGRVFRIGILCVVALFMLVPLYLLVINAFKSQQDILAQPFGMSWGSLSLQYLWNAITSPTFNVIGGYAVTIFFVICVGVLSLAVSIPAAYVIARGTRPRHRVVLLVMLTGLFIPSQVLVIPVIYVLRTIGLMGTVPGFLLFETTLTIPISLFLFTGFIQSIPRELDEAGKIDGAGRWRVLVTVIVPLMRPAIATVVVLNAVGVWADFVNPEIILGPASGLYTVTTGVYAAISQYSTNFTLVYPDLLFAITPIFVFFIFMQRQVIGGLTAGALKG
jgi:raffinose/stachyose/melibiose transport system permease protein